MHTLSKESLYEFAWMGVNQEWHKVLKLKQLVESNGMSTENLDRKLEYYQSVLDELSAIQYSIYQSEKLQKKRA